MSDAQQSFSDSALVPVEYGSILVMTSQSSGHIYMGNRTELRHCIQRIPVPAEHHLMISLKRLVRDKCFRLYRHRGSYSNKFCFLSECLLSRACFAIDFDFDAADMYYAGHDRFFLYADCQDRSLADISNAIAGAYQSFQFFFSFFSQHDKPQRLSQFVWNCSVKNYPSFQRHVDCNLWTECDDGRDEHQHCPFSSAECQGLVAMCGRCYKFSKPLPNDTTSDEYCKHHGGFVGFPSCVSDFYFTLEKTSQHFRYLVLYNVGLELFHPLLPNMYKFTPQSADRTVFFHHFNVFNNDMIYRHFKYSIAVQLRTMTICSLKEYPFGTVCEIRSNMITNHQLDKIPISSALELSAKRHYYSIECYDGDMTHKHVACDSNRHDVCQQQVEYICHMSDQTLHLRLVNSPAHRAYSLSTFTCSRAALTTLSFSLVCDFIADCPDSSDESFCQHPICSKSFTCSNGQCVSYSRMCEGIPQCRDDSDKAKCEINSISKGFKRLPSPVRIDFDGIRYFTVTRMNINEACPDSHYRCPGEFNNCLPIYTRCNGMYDCIGHEDEEWCEEITCQGLLQCRHSPICVHGDHICDGWPHCPHHDDETWCDMACPVNSCLCKAHSFLCPKPFNAKLFPDIRYLYASSSGMTLSDISDNSYLISLVLSHCSLTVVPKMNLLNLKCLDLSHNRLNYVNISSIVGLINMQAFSLSNNPLTLLNADHSVAAAVHTPMPLSVDLSYTNLKVLDSAVWTTFASLQELNLTYASIHTISPGGFQYIPHLTDLYLDGSPVETFSANIFKDLSRLRLISTHNYKLCCPQILPNNFDGSCVAPRYGLLSCGDLLQSWMYRGFLWLVACLSISGNMFCLCARVLVKRMTSSSGFAMFVVNLTIADFLMGVYMTIIGVADEHYRGEYIFQDHSWKISMACKIAGYLCLLSSETSALLICLITLDRFIVLCFPFTSWRFGKTSASVTCTLIWLFGWLLALLPLLPVTAHWEFYGQTAICISLPVMNRNAKGQMYSFSVMIVLNFVLFMLISVGQALIYWSIKSNTLKTNSTKVSKDMVIAQRLISIAMTDFMCWFPIGLCGILALSGIPIPGHLNVALTVLILPLNSAVNPFMYTLNIWAEKQTKSKESKLLKWIETHSSVLA